MAKVSAKKQDENTEARGVKYDGGKVRHSLLPKGALNEVLEVLEMGAQKYAADNWKHVDNPQERYYNAMQRHIDSWWNDEVIDSESKRHHLAHAICCAMFLIWFDSHANDQKLPVKANW